MLPVGNASFFDLGCGKGKAVIMARKLCPFRRVVGVDYYRPFIDAARSNIESSGLTHIDLVCGNAEKFTGFDEISVVYMYNPFDAYIMEQVRENLEKNTKHCTIIYNKPVHLDVFQGWTMVEYRQGWNVDWHTAILSYNAESNAKTAQESIAA